jgi:hypothetical protein
MRAMRITKLEYKPQLGATKGALVVKHALLVDRKRICLSDKRAAPPVLFILARIRQLREGLEGARGQPQLK